MLQLFTLILSFALLNAFASASSSECSETESCEESSEIVKYTVPLGGDCSEVDECTAAFSTCKARKCVCVDGTKKSGLVCIPEVRHCPVGKPLVDSRKRLVVCDPNPYNNSNLVYDAKSLKLDEDTVEAPNSGTCPFGHVCFSEGDLSYGVVKGFCCPVPAKCPIGKPDRNRTCSFSDDSGLEYCPYHTHYCYTSANGVIIGQVCCPKPCPAGSIYKDGACEQPVSKLGESCDLHLNNLHCTAISAECYEGKCRCPEDMVFSARNENCRRPSCSYTNESLNPFRDSKGNYLMCPANKCPENYYCSDGDNVCCPKPAPICSYDKVLSRSEVHACLAYEDETGCPKGKYCRNLYSEVNPNATTFKESGQLNALNRGVCCDE